LEDNQLVLALEGVTLNEYDALVIPTCEDKLGYEELFFLREQCFELDREKCTLELNGEYLTVDRKTGDCSFSQNIRLVGAEKLTLDGRWSLTVLDVLCQMLKQGPLGSVKINLPSAREDKYTPDIQIEDNAVYIVEERLSSQERCELRTKLKLGGVIKKFMLYEFSFNFEIGGERIKIGFESV